MERLIRIGSVSDASRARRLLLDEGLRTRLTKTEIGKDGCVWGLKAEVTHLSEITLLLMRHGIPYEIIG